MTSSQDSVTVALSLAVSSVTNVRGVTSRTQTAISVTVTRQVLRTIFVTLTLDSVCVRRIIQATDVTNVLRDSTPTRSVYVSVLSFWVMTLLLTHS